MRSHILSALSYPLQVIVGLLIYRKSSQTLHGQGTARFTLAEQSAFKQPIWEHVNALLVVSQKKHVDRNAGGEVFWILGGDGPSEADAVAFGFIAGALVCIA